jgi:hypothetical protein
MQNETDLSQLVALLRLLGEHSHDTLKVVVFLDSS